MICARQYSTLRVRRQAAGESMTQLKYELRSAIYEFESSAPCGRKVQQSLSNGLCSAPKARAVTFALATLYLRA